MECKYIERERVIIKYTVTNTNKKEKGDYVEVFVVGEQGKLLALLPPSR